jgi:hypothetical protein
VRQRARIGGLSRPESATLGLFETVERLALNPDQIETLELVENPAPGKVYRDPRAARFVDLFGDVRQVEVDAIEPDTLRALYADALAGYWDVVAYQATRDQEQADLADLVRRDRRR